MRQIEDRWRINISDPPNTSEMYLNLINNFKMNSSQQRDVRGYSNYVLRNYITNKCSNRCLSIDNINYKSCIENCSTKLLQSNKILDEQLEEFQDKARKLGDKVFFN